MWYSPAGKLSARKLCVGQGIFFPFAICRKKQIMWMWPRWAALLNLTPLKPWVMFSSGSIGMKANPCLDTRNHMYMKLLHVKLFHSVAQINCYLITMQYRMASKLNCKSGICLPGITQVVLFKCYSCLQLLKSDMTEITPWYTLSNTDTLMALSEKANITLSESVSAQTHAHVYK